MYISGEEEVVVLVSTTNEKVASCVGLNFVSSHLQGDKYRFSGVGHGNSFEPNIRRIYQQGNDCVFESGHSFYHFRLLNDEKLVMGCTVVQTI